MVHFDQLYMVCIAGYCLNVNASNGCRNNNECSLFHTELSVVVQTPTYCHNSTSVAPSNGDTVVPGNCETVVIEHHVPREHIRHQRHNAPKSAHLGDGDVVMVLSSDSDKEESDSPCTPTCEQDVTVTGPRPRVIAPLTDGTVIAGHSTTLECTFADGDDASVRWFRDAEQLEPSEQFEHVFDGCVAKLVVANVRPTCAGRYRCIVSTPGGEAETSASIVVEGKSFLSLHPTKLSCSPCPRSHINYINYGSIY